LTVPRRIHVLGVPVDLLTQQQIIDVIVTSVAEGQKTILANQNLHGVYTYYTDESFRKLHRQSLIFIDGMSLVLLGSLTDGEISRQHRNTPLDWILPVLELANAKAWRVFYLGGTRDCVQKGAYRLTARVPGLEIGWHDGFSCLDPDSGETNEVVEQINAFRPHILCVGMGMPLQERWILRNIHRIHANVLIPVGGLIEYFSGLTPIPPRYLGRIGLEWLFRLITNPRRYGFRYLVEPWIVAGLVLRARRAAVGPEGFSGKESR
jgi:N-acetylglucosaminyldiphosphoundecaprenol N-acetyl-beta-D-mannosaminyltransferase